MLYQIAADIVILLHFIYILFVVAGGMLVFKWRWLVWLHIPATIWGALIALTGWLCPLTPLENWLRQAGGLASYSSGFIERYLAPVIYPTGFSREAFIAMGVVVIVINVCVYTFLYIKHYR